MKTILILCGGREAVPGIRSIMEMGINVIVADGDPDCPGAKIADNFLCANIYDADEVIIVIKKFFSHIKIDGVLTIAADNVIAWSKIAKFLSVNGPSWRSAMLSVNKILQKDIFKKNCINIPNYFKISNYDDLVTVLDNHPNEYVLKPDESRGARGVIRIRNKAEAEKAFSHSIQFSSKNLILEEWLNGPQLSVEAIVWDGKVYLCGVADRNYDLLEVLYPFVIENGGETPSKFSPEFDNDLTKILQECTYSVGLKCGTIKGDVVIYKGKPYIIEVTIRLSGGYWSTITIPRVYGINLSQELAKISLGQTPILPLNPLNNIKFQSNRFIFSEAGKIKNIHKPEISEETDIYEVYYNKGDLIQSISDHTKRLGMVMSITDSRDSSIKNVSKIINNTVINLN